MSIYLDNAATTYPKPESVYAAIGACHIQAGPHYIVGAGCEIPRETAVANVHALTKYAREHRP